MVNMEASRPSRSPWTVRMNTSCETMNGRCRSISGKRTAKPAKRSLLMRSMRSSNGMLFLRCISRSTPESRAKQLHLPITDTMWSATRMGPIPSPTISIMAPSSTPPGPCTTPSATRAVLSSSRPKRRTATSAIGQTLNILVSPALRLVSVLTILRLPRTMTAA